MLEQIDLSKKLDKAGYKAAMSELEPRMGELQREARALRIPVVIVFEGWDAAGKGTLINRLLLSLDPRGFRVYPTNPPNEEERLRPFLWRFWVNTPEEGTLAIFDRSWYGKVLVERVEKLAGKKEWSRAYDEITSFERQLVDGGSVIIKLFLHISRREQRKRFDKLLGNPSTAWKVTPQDWRSHRQYEAHREAMEEALARTDTGFAPWTVVEAHDRRHATVKVFETAIGALERKVREAHSSKTGSTTASEPAAQPTSAPSSVLDRTDLSLSLDRPQYERALKQCQRRIKALEHEVYVKRLPVVVVYEGWDAAGKGGNIKRLVEGMDPRGYEVIPIGAPNDLERGHHYLWRFWTKVPKAGHIAIFDRSWYGRVLVERVEGFCRADEWRRAYAEINEMEAQWANFGTVLVKLWLQVDSEEQLRRFQERQANPHKQWKITDEDWRNREKFDEYKAAVDEMLIRTSTAYAPWTVVESNCKWYARLKALRTVMEAVEERL